MEENIAIKITGLSKKYNISQKKIGIGIGERFREIVTSSEKNKKDDFYALRDINLTIQKGESIGLIGRNGAGKSTLLKILAEVVEPTEGKVEINGTVASVLEIGMGFHPELSGRENVYLSAAMFGISKNKISEIFGEILEFSGIEKFIDTPVKRYSNGMYLRLAFAVVANLDADILLFDETLSTGDLAFQIKCYEKIESLIKSGKTVLLVSHNLNDIVKISNRIVYFENGLVKSDSQSNSLNDYIKDSLSSNSLFTRDAVDSNIQYADKRVVEFGKSDYSSFNDDLIIKKIYVCAVNKSINDEILTSDELEINIEYSKQKDIDFFDIGLTFSFLNSIIVFSHSLNSEVDIAKYTNRGNYVVKVRIPPNFFNNINIQIGFSISKNYHEIIFANKNFINITLKKPTSEIEKLLSEEADLLKYLGPIYPKWEWTITN